MELAEKLSLNSSIRLLVLEDDGEDFLILSRILEKLPELKAVPVRASGFDEGLEMMRQALFDAVVVDFRLEARDGLEFISEARSQGQRCPMILLTGKGASNTALAALRQGAADYLSKDGLNPETLERSLRYAIERQHSYEAMRRSDEYYRSIIDNSQDLITIIDEKATIQFESPSVKAILGYGPQERMGKDLYDFLHDKDTYETGRRLDMAVRGAEGEVEGEYRMRHKDGSWRHMEYKAKNLLQLSGLKGVLFNARDITERKRGIETLLKVERMAFLGQMTAGMAHEVRNPLAIIKMSAEMLRDSPGSGPEEKRQAVIIVEQCQRLLKLMTETLNYSRNRPGELVSAQPRELLEHSYKLARVQFGSAHEKVTLVWMDAQETPPIVVDRQKAELVLVNLILNAFQAMGEGGRLGLGWLASGDGILFIVEDNGPGMTEEQLERIFDPFYTTKQQGSGLGLWLCQRMVEVAGGRLGVESGRGRGTRFTMWLPYDGGKIENPGH